MKASRSKYGVPSIAYIYKGKIYHDYDPFPSVDLPERFVVKRDYCCFDNILFVPMPFQEKTYPWLFDQFARWAGPENKKEVFNRILDFIQALSGWDLTEGYKK